MEIAGSHEMAHKIDRLSLLPNELLDHIFDLAYSIDSRSTGALSKRLLSFHVTGIYRRIWLSKADNIAKLVRKINKSPDVAKTVQMLHLSMHSDPLGVFETIATTEMKQFFRQLVHLEWLVLGNDNSQWLDKYSPAKISSCLPSLRHLTSPAARRSRQPLPNFASFTTLRSLNVTQYNSDYEAFDTTRLLALPLLTRLTISGTCAESLSIASFCTLCPNLTWLSLQSPAPNYTPLLETLPTSLVHLELAITNHEGNPCGQELLRFVHLRHLSIDSSLFPYDLPKYLKSSLDLESLELGEGPISANGLIQLIRELPSLGYLNLDSFSGFIGSRLEVDVTRCQASGLLAADERFGDAWDWGWDVPAFSDGEVDGTTLEAALEMLYVAEEAGVRVEGSMVEAVRVMEAYYLELANVAIYRCYRHQTFEYYIDIQEQEKYNRLPRLDLDSLDPNNLELVKTELPDEGWFALSLKAANE